MQIQSNKNICPYKQHFTSKRALPSMLEYPTVSDWVEQIVSPQKSSFWSRILDFVGKNKNVEYPKTNGRLSISKDEHIILKDYLFDTFEYIKNDRRQERYSANPSRLTLGQNFLKKLYEVGCITDEDLPKLFMRGAGLIDKSDFLYFVGLKKKITIFDTDKVLASRNLTYNIKMPLSNELLLEKQQQILARELELIKNIPSNKQLILVHGAPGSGKSSLVNKIANRLKGKYYYNEADKIKTEFYEDLSEDIGGIQAHRLAKDLLIKEIYPHLLDGNRNFIYQATNDLYIEKILKQALEKNYDVSFIMVHSPKEVNIPRIIERQERINRFTDPYDAYLIENLGDNAANILKSYPQIKQYFYMSESKSLSRIN